MKLTRHKRPTPSPNQRFTARHIGPCEVWFEDKIQKGRVTWTTTLPNGVLMSRRQPTLVLDDGRELGHHQVDWLRIAIAPDLVGIGDFIDVDGITEYVTRSALDGLGGTRITDEEGTVRHLVAGTTVLRYDRDPSAPTPEPKRTAHLDHTDPFAGLPGA